MRKVSCFVLTHTHIFNYIDAKLILDLRTEEATIISITKLAKRLGTKDNLYSPSPMILQRDKAFGGKIVGRDESLQFISDHLKAECIADRLSIFALQGASGSGKSAFLDYVAEAISREEPEEPFLVICASFNGRTDVGESAMSVDAFKLALAARILFSVFFDRQELFSWDKFEEIWKNVEILGSLHLTQFLMGILKTTKATRFMLCLDEVTKCPNVDELLSDIAQCLDRTKVCSMFLVTALDPLIFGSKTKSNGEIIWVPLPLLTEQQSLSLFVSASSSPPPSLAWQSNILLQILLRDACGHPRTLSALKLAEPELKIKLRDIALGYAELLQIVQKYLNGKRVLFPDFSIPFTCRQAFLAKW